MQANIVPVSQAEIGFAVSAQVRRVGHFHSQRTLGIARRSSSPNPPVWSHGQLQQSCLIFFYLAKRLLDNSLHHKSGDVPASSLLHNPPDRQLLGDLNIAVQHFEHRTPRSGVPRPSESGAHVSGARSFLMDARQPILSPVAACRGPDEVKSGNKNEEPITASAPTAPELCGRFLRGDEVSPTAILPSPSSNECALCRQRARLPLIRVNLWRMPERSGKSASTVGRRQTVGPALLRCEQAYRVDGMKDH